MATTTAIGNDATDLSAVLQAAMAGSYVAQGSGQSFTVFQDHRDQRQQHDPGAARPRSRGPQLAGLDGVKLHPGMPATVMLPTDSRTAFEYIMGPLAASFRHSFKQK